MLYRSAAPRRGSACDEGCHCLGALRILCRRQGTRIPESVQPFDIVHVVHSAFPEDPRVRREAMVAASTGARVAVVALGDGAQRSVARYGPVAVVRLPGSRRRGSVGRYVVEYLDFVLRARRLIARDPRFHGARVFHVHTLPDFLVAATTPARRRGARVILDLHEIFPEFTASRFRGVVGRLGQRAALRIERWSRERADVTVTVNRPIAALLHGRPARADERIVVVHNLADPAEFGERTAPNERSGSTLRFAYHGTLTALYGVDIAIRAVHAARARGLDVSFDIFGGGNQTDELRGLITALGLDGSVWLRGVVRPDVLRERLPQYDGGLIATRLDVMTRFSLSTKLLEYVHFGVPLVIPRIPTYLDYFPEPCAWYFDPNDAESAAASLQRFTEASPAERAERARRAQGAAAHLDWRREADGLRAIYHELLGRSPHPR